MTDEIEKQTESITVEFRLDSTHESMVEQLKEEGIDVEEVLFQQLQPSAEETIYKIFQSAKYSEQ